MGGEQLEPSINRDSLVAGLGGVALESIRLADSETLLTNLRAVGTKSRNLRTIFPRLAAHGSEAFPTLVDFVLTLHAEAEAFITEDLSGFVSLAQVEQRMPTYLKALLKDEDSPVVNTATSLWFGLVEQLYGQAAGQSHSRPTSVPAPQLKGDYYNLPRKKKKQIRKSISQQELSANQARKYQ